VHCVTALHLHACCAAFELSPARDGNNLINIYTTPVALATQAYSPACACLSACQYIYIPLQLHAAKGGIKILSYGVRLANLPLPPRRSCRFVCTLAMQ